MLHIIPSLSSAQKDCEADAKSLSFPTLVSLGFDPQFPEYSEIESE